MNGNGNKALAQAQEMLAESGRLDIPARRKLWQAMGALEVWYGANVIQRTSARKISSKKCESRRQTKEKLGLADTSWVDAENKILGLELKEFFPNIYIYDRPYDDFIRY